MSKGPSGPGRRIPLGPPDAFVTASRAAMGAIDFDAWSTPLYNRLVSARRFNDYELADVDTICNNEWDIVGEGRTVCIPPASIPATRRLLNRILREYRQQRITQACVLVTATEAATKIPWIWDFPVAMPFTRMPFRWYDDEFSVFRPVSTALWGFVLYFPRGDDQDLYQQSMARFYDAFAPLSRIVFNELCGEDAWKEHYKRRFGRSFNESR